MTENSGTQHCTPSASRRDSSDCRSHLRAHQHSFPITVMSYSKGLIFSVCFMAFTSAYIMFKIQRVKEKALTDMVSDTGARYFLPVLLQAGLWSPEMVASIPIHLMPSALLKDQQTKAATQDLKRWVREKLMLQNWMRDIGHAEFVPLIQSDSLKQWGYKVPTIHRVLHTNEIDPERDAALRHVLKTDYERFLQAVAEFKTRTTFALNKIPSYEADIKHRAQHYLPENMWRFLSEQNFTETLQDLVLSVVYTLIGYLVVTISATYSQAGGPLWAMVAYWVHPPTGRLCFHGAVLLGSHLHGPVAGLFALIITEAWMLATAVYMGSSLLGTLLISVAPTFIIFIILEVLLFQPILTVEADGKHFLTISGLGDITNALKSFIKKPRQNWIIATLFGTKAWQGELDLATITGFSFEDVNLDGELILQLIKPSMKHNSIECLSISNNHSLTDNNIRILGDACNDNVSLQMLRIVYHDLMTPWQKICCVLQWDDSRKKPTAVAVNYVLERYLEHPSKHQIKINGVDFTGIDLSRETVDLANQLRNKVPGIKIQGEKGSGQRAPREKSKVVAGISRMALVAWCFWCFYTQLRDPHRLFTNL